MTAKYKTPPEATALLKVVAREFPPHVVGHYAPQWQECEQLLE
jgi:hypothetical protein